MIFKPVFLRYIFAGLILNGLSFIFFVVLLEYLHFSSIMAVSVQYPIIICIYYLIQTYFVFNKKANLEYLIKPPVAHWICGHSHSIQEKICNSVTLHMNCDLKGKEVKYLELPPITTR